jgi:hypothetical protein
MQKRLNWQLIMKGLWMSLLLCGLFSVADAQPTKKYQAKFDKFKKLFQSPTLDVPGGKIVVSGEVRGVEVSGGGDGCYTLTVSTYRLAPTGEKILVRTRSRRICVDITKLPEIVVERVPRGKYIIEVAIDRPRGFDEKILEAEINVTYPAETIRP